LQSTQDLIKALRGCALGKEADAQTPIRIADGVPYQSVAAVRISNFDMLSKRMYVCKSDFLLALRQEKVLR
jgi:hypothetical protein